MIYEIGGRRAEIISVHDDVYALCRDYRTDKAPDFSIKTAQADIDFEREKSARENIKEGKPVINYPDGYLETLAVYRKIAEKMTEHDTFLFHGSCVAVDGEGYLFTAKSGTGKSTHARLWRELFVERAVMVNDDKPLIKIDDNGAVIYGTPWNGKHNLGENISVPLKAVCILERGEENFIAEITKSDAFPMLLQQAYRPQTPAALSKTLDLLNRMGSKVRLYRLRCNMDIEAAKVAYNGMKG